MSNMLYQIGTIHSLLSGVYEGDMSFEELIDYGDFGLGTFDRVNGEMILIDGNFYRIDANGKAKAVDSKMKTPLAIVTNFKEPIKSQLRNFKNLESLKGYIESTFESQNIIYAIRIEGEFSKLNLRSEHPQPEGHKPLDQTISQVQTTSTLTNTHGTMVGFWFPKYMKTINLPGFHFHFLDKEHKRGGHLFNMEMIKATLKIIPIFDFGMHLIHTPLFENINLNNSNDSSVKKVEVESVEPIKSD